MNSTCRPFASSQQGFATILIVLLVGLAIASSVLGTAYYLKSSQKSLAASHALTNAQSGAWTGVEVFREYLNDLDGTAILALPKNKPIMLNVQHGRKLKVDHIEPSQTSISPEKYQVSAQIQNISDISEASSTIQAVYEITFDSSSSQPSNGKITGINIYGDVTVSGNVHIDGGDKALINIQGNFSTTGSGFTGVDTLSVTGNVDLRGGGERIKTIISNGNVYLGAGSEVDYVYAKGTVIIESGKQEGEIYADQDIIINNGSVKVANTLMNINLIGGGTGTLLVAGGNINVNNGSVGTADATGAITFSGARANTLTSSSNIIIESGTIGTANAKGAITFSGNAATSLISGGNIIINNGEIISTQALGSILINNGTSITNVFAKGNITLAKGKSTQLFNILTEQKFICNTEWWEKFDSIKAKSIESTTIASSVWINNVEHKNYPICPNPNRSSKIDTSSKPTFSLLIQDIVEPQIAIGSTKSVPITEKTGIDAYNYRSQANYIFSQQNNGAIIKVTLQNIENAELNGKTFYLGTFPYSYSDWGYLCETIINKVCQSTPVAKITQNSSGNGDSSKQITYSNDKWDINVSFKGNSYNSGIPSQPDLIPGIMFFEGNLDIGNGSFINTFIATKDIKFTGAGTTVYAPNYVKKELICDRSFFPEKNFIPNIYIKPTNLCQATALDIGNIALLAGSYLRTVNPDGTLSKTSTYQGGNITLATAYIYGNIMAGNRYYVNNTGHVVGSITAENLLNPNDNKDPSKLYDTTIDLTKVDTSSNSNNGTTKPNDNPSDKDRAKLRWSRYI